MNVAEQLEQKGRKIGWQEGLQEGRQEGRQEGLHAGCKEIARNMLAIGLERATIELTTGLSSAELDALKNSAA